MVWVGVGVVSGPFFLQQYTKTIVLNQKDKMKRKGIRINRYRIAKAYECFIHGMRNGRNAYWSFRLALWWFSAGFVFEGDKQLKNV